MSEIINSKYICNSVKISDNTNKLFSSNKNLCLLYKDKDRTKYYNIPDCSYTLDDLDKCKFKLIFGQTPINNNYYFYTSINNCLDSINTNTNTNDNKKYGIIRYAIFYNEDNIIDNNYDIKIQSYDNFYPLSYHGTFINKNTQKRVLL